MCGLVGFLPAPPGPAAEVDFAELRCRVESLAPAGADEGQDAIVAALEVCSWQLVRQAGFRLLWEDESARAAALELARETGRAADELESALATVTETATLERRSARLTRLRDVAWRIEQDALGNVERVGALLNERADAGLKVQHELWRLAIVLNNLARLEVRGRDSGGIATTILLPEDRLASVIEGFDPELEAAWSSRRKRRDFRHGAVLVGPAAPDAEGRPRRAVAFAHKVASEIGELGANITELRDAIRADRILQTLLAEDGAEVTVIAHNRWASNGVINEANCHPLSNELANEPESGGELARLVTAALNGDIDNYPTLRDRFAGELGRRISPQITTDAKIIPVVYDEALDRVAASEAGADQAFAESVATFEGSWAIAAHSTSAPEDVRLAQRGSGQGLFIGLIPDGGRLFASELYGVVELCESYVKLDGLARGDGPAGETVRLRPGVDPVIVGIDGEPRDFGERERQTGITTRDINKAGFEHYLLKEINEAPLSIRKTLRGKLLTGAGGTPRLELGEDIIPPALRGILERRELRRIFVIGQGTAAIAGASFADAMNEWLAPANVAVFGLKATELSGFHLETIGPDCLIIAVSQSGTTTDTNRTVDLARERGATVIGVVNRRNSDLADKSDGVFYTSDGRDIEMSVASTKAFYCQVVAGYLLGMELARRLGCLDEAASGAFLAELADLPRRMGEVLENRDRVRGIARAHAGRRVYWAVVGSGPGRRAAEEIRIKLSELCYKSISADTIEDKKHIDLSAEALVFVCAAGLSGANAADAVKEIGIFKAHAGLPIVVCDRGETRFSASAAATIEVPASSPRIALLLNTLAGHLFGYYAALALDEGSLALRRLRQVVEAALVEVTDSAGEPGVTDQIIRRFRERARPLARELLADLHDGRFNSGLTADIACQVGDALRICLGHLSVEAIADFVQPPERKAWLELVMAWLSSAIDHLKRPVDAIKHQAKTVTVGISREEAKLPLDTPLIKALADAEVAVEHFDEATAATLAAAAPYVREVLGCTTYAVSGLSPLGRPGPGSTLKVVRKTGCAAGMASRADAGAPLTGTKRMVVSAPRVTFGRGVSDGRCLVIAPLFEAGRVSGLGLLHVAFRDDLDPRERAQALRLAGRFEDVRALVTEQGRRWQNTLLMSLAVEDLLTLAPAALASAMPEREAT